MTETETKAEDSTITPENRLNGTDTDQIAEAKQRAKECSAELDVVLAKFRCRIRAWPSAENVGDGSKVLLSGMWDVFPEANPEG